MLQHTLIHTFYLQNITILYLFLTQLINPDSRVDSILNIHKNKKFCNKKIPYIFFNLFNSFNGPFFLHLSILDIQNTLEINQLSDLYRLERESSQLIIDNLCETSVRDKQALSSNPTIEHYKINVP